MFSRKAAVLAVTLILALTWCAAAARPAFSLPTRGEASASLEQLRVGFWSWLLGAWTKEGCGIDPSGKPVCGLKNAGGSKAGCGLDPGGAKEGCTIDPGGKPVCGPASATSNAVEGCGIDPGGSPCSGRQ